MYVLHSFLLNFQAPPLPPHLPHTPPHRQRFNTERLEELEYSVCVAPIANEVALAEEGQHPQQGNGSTVLPPPQGQWWTAKAALLLWLWLDQQCAM